MLITMISGLLLVQECDETAANFGKKNFLIVSYIKLRNRFSREAVSGDGLNKVDAVLEYAQNRLSLH